MKAPMKHRDRVAAALNHETPDRVPIQISFTPEFADRLRRELRITGAKDHNPHGGGNTYQLERALDEDMLLTSVGWANNYYRDSEAYVDEWGVGWKPVHYQTPHGHGYYTEVVSHPLTNPEALRKYRPPNPDRPELYAEAAAMIAAYKDEYWIVGVTVTTIWETAVALRGFEHLLGDLATDPEFVDALLDVPCRYHLAAARRLVEMGVDMLWLGDDVGTQKGMLMSPAMWRRFLKPRLASFIGSVKSLNPSLKVAYHSDGNVFDIVPELIEIGVDILNPIQPACMDPAEVKTRFGDRLCFWGTIDEQHTLPFGTPGEVRAEVQQRINTVGRNGGLILGPTHHVQLDTPMENFWA
ncbi:hypothetical protein HQ590_02355, partial [bacterium]|nr:hypothetical protein [bacterium]